MKKIIRYVLTWPAFLGWLFPLLTFVFFMSRDLRFIGDGVLAATWRNWVTGMWKYSTTLSRGIVFQPDVPPHVVEHEKVHVRQVEDRLVLALTIALLVSVLEWHWGWMFLWISGVAWQIPNFLGAVLRNGHVYRDAEHERSAYAQTDDRSPQGGRSLSWLERHLADPRDW